MRACVGGVGWGGGAGQQQGQKHQHIRSGAALKSHCCTKPTATHAVMTLVQLHVAEAALPIADFAGEVKKSLAVASLSVKGRQCVQQLQTNNNYTCKDAST